MKHSIATVSLSGTLYQKLDAIADAGFDGIELFENDLITSPYSPKEIKQYCDDLNLEILLYQPFRNFEGHPHLSLSVQLERARKKFDLMASMEIQKILVCSSVLPNTISSIDHISEEFFQLAELAKTYQIEVGYEALAWGSYINSYRQVWEVVKRVDHPNLGIILDSFHSLSIQDDLNMIEEIPGNKISFLQLADGPFLKMDVLPWSRHYRNFPGQGDFDLVSFLTPILKAGYTGPLSLEVFNDNFRALPPKKTALDARRSLLYLENITLEALKRSSPKQFLPEHLKTTIKNDPCTTHNVSYNGLQYLELTAFEDHAVQLKRWLIALGFSLNAVHKTKNISLYQQGSVQLIVNEEKDSYGYAYYLQHGASLLSIGFSVTDPKRIYKNAHHYLYPTLNQEADTPPILSPDNSLHYFITSQDKTYLQHFEEISQAVSNPSQLVKIDHYALGLPAESLTSWLLYYRAVLGLQSEEELSLPELYGSMTSKLIRSCDQSINIPLNVTHNKLTQLGKSVSQSQGVGLQHIALQTLDLVQAIQYAQEQGVRFLPIPPNYYEDLSARFNLEQSFIDHLQHYQILYDQDTQGGELLHIYTENFDNKFSIELIERKNNYSEYGSPNTPIRIAASHYIS